MPRHCSAGGCKSRDNRGTRNAGITFHKLPKGASRRSLWITNSHRADSWDPQTDFVYFCSKHFTPESFELTGCSGIRRLKENAFPTVFESSTAKCIRARAMQKREHTPDRKSPHIGVQDVPQGVKDEGETSTDPTDERSTPTPEDGSEKTLISPQEPRQDSDPPSPPRPLSPSCYMRRLPPPPGAYLSREHSYAQLCPLLWRRRYDQAIECLEKALRQLHAARRRENRLRSTVTRLRDKRLRQATLVSAEDGGKNKGVKMEEGKADGLGDKIQVNLGPGFLSDADNWSEVGYCFNCGVRQGQDDRQVAGKVSKTGNEPVVNEDPVKVVETDTSSGDETTKGMQKVGWVKTQTNSKEGTNVEDRTHPHVLLQSRDHMIPPGECQLDAHKQGFQDLGSQGSEGAMEARVQELDHHHQHQHLQQQTQQVFLIQDGTDGRVLLVPVLCEDELQNHIKMEEAPDEARSVRLSEEDSVRKDSVHNSETIEAIDEEQDSEINTASGETREDMRMKLKEHLEGFHLQLTTEFLN